jgi:(p)ppGpp synthase/HD superfamily hydrolase
VLARLPQTRAAVAYAQECHAGQRRKADGAPFIEHPLEVGWLLYGAGAPDHVIAAGVLHDAIEKAGVSASDLQQRFGPRVTRLVLAVSDDPRIRSYARRKAALREQATAAGPEAMMVFAADKISKVRELRLVPSPAKVPLRRLTHYRRSVELLESRLGGSPLVAQLRAEFDREAEAAVALA